MFEICRKSASKPPRAVSSGNKHNVNAVGGAGRGVTPDRSSANEQHLVGELQKLLKQKVEG